MIFDSLTKTIIRGYEYYNTRLLKVNSVVHGGLAKVSGNYWYGIRPSETGILTKVTNGRRSLTYKRIPEGSYVLLDESCKIPATLVKTRYNVVSANTVTVPEYAVLGADKSSSTSSNDYPFHVFVSDELKKIILVYESGYTNFDEHPEQIPTLSDYREQLGLIVDDVDFSSFEPFGNDCCETFRLYYNSSELYTGFLNGTIPAENVVLEENLVTGTQECTAELLFSCWQLIQSSDTELRKTAILTLANSDYSKCKEFLRHLLSSAYFDVCDYRYTSTTAKWMFSVLNVTRYTGYCPFTELGDIKAAKEFLTLVSNGSIVFNGNIMSCTDIKYLRGWYGGIRKRLKGLNYDLETATLIANDR